MAAFLVLPVLRQGDSIKSRAPKSFENLILTLHVGTGRRMSSDVFQVRLTTQQEKEDLTMRKTALWTTALILFLGATVAAYGVTLVLQRLF